jgi:hypothetical protein
MKATENIFTRKVMKKRRRSVRAISEDSSFEIRSITGIYHKKYNANWLSEALLSTVYTVQCVHTELRDINFCAGLLTRPHPFQIGALKT